MPDMPDKRARQARQTQPTGPIRAKTSRALETLTLTMSIDVELAVQREGPRQDRRGLRVLELVRFEHVLVDDDLDTAVAAVAGEVDRRAADAERCEIEALDPRAHLRRIGGRLVEVGDRARGRRPSRLGKFGDAAVGEHLAGLRPCPCCPTPKVAPVRGRETPNTAFATTSADGPARHERPERHARHVQR